MLELIHRKRPPRPLKVVRASQMMSLLGNAVQVAAKAQAEVMVIFFAGAIAASMGLFTSKNLPLVSKFQLAILQPCLILSLNQSFTLAHLYAWSPVLVVALIHISLGAALGQLGARLLRVQSPRSELLVLTTAFGNCGALPFVLVLPIVRQWPVTRDDPAAAETGLAVIGLYLFVWFVVFFSVGTHYVGLVGSKHMWSRTCNHEPPPQSAPRESLTPV